MAVSLLSFLVMFIVLETEVFFLMGTFLAPGLNWPVMLALLSPSVSLIAVTLIVRGSAKAQSMEESQQSAVFLILPPSPFDRGTGFRPYAGQPVDPADFKPGMYRDRLESAEKSPERLYL